MSIDNADLIKRLENALDRIEGIWIDYKPDRRTKTEAEVEIRSVINDLKTMVDDGK